MPVVGITGGIATGKTTFVRTLLRHLPARVFDADQAAHRLLESDAQVRLDLRATFGEGVFDTAGVPDRGRIRELVFSDPERRAQLERILHPAIRAIWISESAECAAAGDWYLVDIPLLFETRAESHFDRVVVVGCSPATQSARLCHERGLSNDMAQRIVAAQIDLRIKMAKADHIIWNDSTAAGLDEQASLLSGWLRQRYG